MVHNYLLPEKLENKPLISHKFDNRNSYNKWRGFAACMYRFGAWRSGGITALLLIRITEVQI
jgi:hypothetical protein